MITIHILGTEQVVSTLLAITPKLRTTLKQAMQKSLVTLLRLVKEDYLSGRALHVRTGRLRRSVHSDLQEGPSGLVGLVGTNVNYGKFHEYGTETVRARLAKLKAGARQQLLFGGGVRGALAQAKATAGSGEFSPHAFLRPALKKLEPEIRQNFEDAIRRGIDGT